MPKTGMPAILPALSSTRIAGVDISYQYQRPPTGGRLVVFLPGFAMPMFVWDELLAQLPKAAGFLRLDYPGRGFSTGWNIHHSMEAYEDLVDGLLDSLEVAKPVHLVGYSFGGALAVRYANRHRSRVCTISLLAPFGTGNPFFCSLAYLARMPVLGEVLALALARPILKRKTANLVAMLPHLADEWKQVPSAKPNVRYLMAMLSFARLCLSRCYRKDYECLGKSRIPATVLWGFEDRIVPFCNLCRMTRYLPYAELCLFPGMDHLLPVRDPSGVLRHLQMFWEKSTDSALDSEALDKAQPGFN